MSDLLLDIVARNRAGNPVAIPSVCTAQEDVLRASLSLAKTRAKPIVIEATSNQVNQDGGYTGMTARDYVDYISTLVREAGIDPNAVILGGDHLGPQAWRQLPADKAMEKARVLVASYVAAGFSKIHLDCSQGCAGEPEQLPDALTAQRTAQLAQACEEARAADQTVLYVIGTEVPPPGGARLDEEGDIVPTTRAAAEATLAAHAEAFEALGLSDLRDRIAGLVVQPGVEFSPMDVHPLPMERDPDLKAAAQAWPNMCLEAHSTDYQTPDVYPRLAQLGFAFQKVGPALTFAYRQALYGLDHILTLLGKQVGLFEVMDLAMAQNPQAWMGHYAPEDRVARHFGYADRIRYYWPRAQVAQCVHNLRHQIEKTPLPDPLVLQSFSPAVLQRAKAFGGPRGEALIAAQIQLALEPYYFEGTGEFDD